MMMKMCLVGFLKTFSVKMKTENNQKIKTIISFSVFSVENRNLILGKIKMR